MQTSLQSVPPVNTDVTTSFTLESVRDAVRACILELVPGAVENNTPAMFHRANVVRIFATIAELSPEQLDTRGFGCFTADELKKYGKNFATSEGQLDLVFDVPQDARYPTLDELIAPLQNKFSGHDVRSDGIGITISGAEQATIKVNCSDRHQANMMIVTVHQAD